MTDVLLYQTDDGGEINITNGTVETDGGLATAVYLSLFGGNDDDAGGHDMSLQWWGNIDDINPYRSRTQYLLRSIPSVPANLIKIEDAVKQDLQWMVTRGVAKSIEVSASMPGLNRVTISINIDGDETLEFLENWL